MTAQLHRAAARFNRISLNRKLSIIVIIQMALSLSFLLFFLSQSLYQEYQRTVNRNHQISELFLADLATRYATIEEITKFPVISSDTRINQIFRSLVNRQIWDPTFCQNAQELMKLYLNANSFVDTIAIYDLEGNGICARQDYTFYSLIKASPDSDWFREALTERGGAITLNPLESDTQGTGLDSGRYYVARSIVNGYRVENIGIIAVGVRTDTLDAFFHSLRQFEDQTYAVYWKGERVAGTITDTAFHPPAGDGDRVTALEVIDGRPTICNLFRYNSDYTIELRTPLRAILGGLADFNFAYFLLILMLFLMIAVVIHLIVRSIVGPLNRMVTACGDITENNFRPIAGENLPPEVDRLFRSFNGMIGHIDRLINEILLKEAAKQSMELQLLRTQINPHYLYNVLECMHMTAYSNRDYKVSQMAELLGKNLQYGLRYTTQEVTVEKELEMTLAYVELIRHHYSDKLQVVMRIDGGVKGCRILKLIFQPLIENAIVHGFSEARRVVTIEILGYRREDSIYFVVTDDGAGIEPEKLRRLQAELETPDLRSDAIGLHNVHRRLQLYYGEEYGVGLDSRENAGTTVTIHLPVRFEGEEHCIEATSGR